MSRVAKHVAAYLVAAIVGALAALALLGWFVNSIVEDVTDMPRAAL